MAKHNMVRGLGAPSAFAQINAPLPYRSLPLDGVRLARFLIGKRLVRDKEGVRLGGRIVETEAYLEDDAASHSFSGPTKRNRSMFARRGHAYVYRIYGMWFCLNVAAGAAGQGAAVLIRAIEPEFGIEHMIERRGAHADIARGPGRLCAAFDIDCTLDGADLCTANGALWLTEGERPAGPIEVSARIGITTETERALRFYERGNAEVSGPRRLRA